MVEVVIATVAFCIRKLSAFIRKKLFLESSAFYRRIDVKNRK